jgi:hypothetical protein
MQQKQFTINEGVRMSTVTILSVFSHKHVARPARSWVDKETKEVRQFEEVAAHDSKCGLVEINDGEGCRLIVEFPAGYLQEIKVGEVLTLDCPSLSIAVERPCRAYDILRHMSPKTK